MKILFKILIAPFTLVAGAVFLSYFLCLFLVYYVLIQINRPWSHNLVQMLNKIWAILTSIPLFSWVWVTGRGNRQKGQPYIIVANHSSYWDIPVCALSLPTTFRFLGKVELVSVPLFGLMFRKVHIPVNRGNRIEAAKSLLIAKEKLSRGLSVVIYPEGTIPDKKTVTLGPFKDGAFRLAVETGVPLLPMTIRGSDKLLPDEKIFLLRPFVQVKVKFDKPIQTKGLSLEDVPRLKMEVYDRIYSNLTGNENGNHG